VQASRLHHEKVPFWRPASGLLTNGPKNCLIFEAHLPYNENMPTLS